MGRKLNLRYTLDGGQVELGVIQALPFLTISYSLALENREHCPSLSLEGGREGLFLPRSRYWFRVIKARTLSPESDH